MAQEVQPNNFIQADAAPRRGLIQALGVWKKYRLRGGVP